MPTVDQLTAVINAANEIIQALDPQLVVNLLTAVAALSV